MIAFDSPRSEREEEAWLRLIRSENVGPATFFALLSRHGSAEAALDALPDLVGKGGRTRKITIAKTDTVRRELDHGTRDGVHFVFWGGANYPPRLAEIYAPPPVLTVRGDPKQMLKVPLAIVGARKASAAGRNLASEFAAAFGEAGHPVVSGLALGIDAASHKAALTTGTIGVVAGGVDKPTPLENVPLAEEIVDAGGAIVSEMPLGYHPVARDYPRRNRLIAGLSQAVLVVEAAAQSGSLHTARYALDANRDLFAVPGSPRDPRAAGCLALLRDGAGFAAEPLDVLSALPKQTHGDPAEIGFSEAQSRRPVETPMPLMGTTDELLDEVADLLSMTPVFVDEIVRATGWAPAVINAALLELELAGRAERDVDGSVRRAIEEG
ncbi:MAG: DNA-processing protein DprA [Pseudomonadota bacterium]